MAIKSIKQYIEINSINTTLREERYDFNDFYNFYLSFKNFGKELYKENNIKPIVITKANELVDLPWPLISINKISAYTFFLPNEIENYFNKLEKEISCSDIYSLAILISEISRVLKLYKYYGKDSIEPIGSKVFKIIESINKKNPIIFEYDNINCFPVLFEKMESRIPKINLMKEDLNINDKNIVIYHNYINVISLIMHFIKIEIMYYTGIVNNAYHHKQCSDCHKLFIGNSELCKTCAGIRAKERRKINKRCNTKRKKIEYYLSIYRESIPSEIVLKSERMLEEQHKYTQEKELNRLCKRIEKIINEKS